MQGGRIRIAFPLRRYLHSRHPGPIVQFDEFPSLQIVSAYSIAAAFYEAAISIGGDDDKHRILPCVAYGGEAAAGIGFLLFCISLRFA